MATRRRSKLVIWLVAVGVLLGLLVIGDRVAAGIAEDKVAGLIASKAADHGVQSERPPDVDITGFPFLTQVIGGEYQQIDIRLDDLSSGELTLPRLDIRAMEVTAALSDVLSGSGPIVAGRMEADGHISYTSLTAAMEEATSAKVTPLGNGQLEIEVTAEIMGVQVPLTGTASVSFNGSVLQVSADSFSAAGVDLPPGGVDIVNRMSETFSREIPLPALPYNLTVEDLRLEQDSMVISASAQNVPLA